MEIFYLKQFRLFSLLMLLCAGSAFAQTRALTGSVTDDSSGFPALKKNPYPGSEIKGDFIRRLPYPDGELIVNVANVNEAISRQGPNDLDTRVWWDK